MSPFKMQMQGYEKVIEVKLAISQVCPDFFSLKKLRRQKNVHLGCIRFSLYRQPQFNLKSILTFYNFFSLKQIFFFLHVKTIRVCQEYLSLTNVYNICIRLGRSRESMKLLPNTKNRSERSYFQLMEAMYKSQGRSQNETNKQRSTPNSLLSYYY